MIFHSHLVSAESYSPIMEKSLKNELFNTVAEQLGVERKSYTLSYRPQSNGRIEGFHNFCKKHVYLNIFLEPESGMTLHH